METTVSAAAAEHVFRTRGKVMLVPGWRGVYGELPDSERSDDDEERDQQLPKLEQGEPAEVREITSLDKMTKPPRRYSEGALLDAMETAGKLVDDDELREAMKDSGIGTPATRAAIIERLLAVGYIERDGRALVVTEKGLNVIRLLGEHALTSPSLTGDWEHRLTRIEHGEDSREAFMGDIVKFARVDRRRTRHQAPRRSDPARQPGPLPGVRARHHRESQGLFVLGARRPGVRIRDLEIQGGQAAAALGGARAHHHRPDREAGHRFQEPRGQELPGTARARTGRPFRVGDDEHVLVAVVHHIAADGWSITPLVRDLGVAYASRCVGKAPQWAPLAVQYVDYTLWQRAQFGALDDQGQSHCRPVGLLAGSAGRDARAAAAPTDRPYPLVADQRGATVAVEWPAGLQQRVAGLARQHNATKFTVVQAALAVLLSRLSASSDVAVGFPIAGRRDPALDELVGFFVNTLVLRVELAGDPTVAELLAQVQQRSLVRQPEPGRAL